MFLIVGLGNPGPRYENTRHNVGFMLLNRVVSESGPVSWSRLGRSLVARTEFNRKPVLLGKPQTFMNLSGEAVRQLLLAHPVELQDLLVLYDDAALPFGKIRIRRSGSSGGQKGMESIIRCLGTEDFPRVRIGIAQETSPPDLSEFVLSEFDRTEREALDEILSRAAEAVLTVVSEGLEQAMARFNS